MKTIFTLLLGITLSGRGFGNEVSPKTEVPLHLRLEKHLLAESGNEVWIYSPKKPPEGAMPCVLIPPAGSPLIHGMKLSAGDSPEHLPYANAGFLVVAFEVSGSGYDANPFSALKEFKASKGGVLDAAEALKYASGKYKIDRSKIFVAGHSSAGTIALDVARSSKVFKGCIAFAPSCEITKHQDMEAIKTLSKFVPGYLEFFEGISPVRNAEKLRCPLFLFYAKDDGHLRPGEIPRYATAVKKFNPRVTVETVDSGGHYRSMISEGIPRALVWIDSLDKVK